MSDWPRLAHLPLLVAGILFVALSHFFLAHVGDDAFIYFRYAERAASGSGWGWTDQQAPVEGYSSPFWYLLLAAGPRLGLSAATGARVWGLLLSLAAFAGTWVLARELRASPAYAGLACLFMALVQGFHYWSTAGLETSLYAAVTTWSAIGLVRGRFWIFPVAVLGIARPEGPILCVAILIAYRIVRGRTVAWWTLALALLPALSWEAIRLAIYELPLANTYYAKATGPILPRLARGGLYGIPVLVPLVLLWLAGSRQRRLEPLICAGLITMLTGVVVIGGGDWMFHFRLLVPVVPLVYASILAHLSADPLGRLLRSSLIVFGVLLPGSLLWTPPNQVLSALSGEQMDTRRFQEGHMTHASIRLAESIRQRHEAGSLIAVNHAGALPWALPEHDFIDMTGLNDRHIAGVEGGLHGKYDSAYVLAREPDLIVLNTRTEPGTDGVWYHEGYWSGETDLVRQPGFAQHYRATELVEKWEWEWDWRIEKLIGREVDRTSWILVYERR